jgi:hypothetical protein
MPNSVIQKRWIASIALVVVVGLLASSNASSWGGHASAATTAVGTAPEYLFQ